VFRSLHLGELGSCVTSLNHYLATRFPFMTLDWRAVCFSHAHNANIEAKFYLQTRARWLRDWTEMNQKGNIMSTVNSVQEKVDLVTADGGIIVGKESMETKNFDLIFAEAVTALKVLRPGGTFIIKFFTLFSERFVGLLRILLDSFQSVQIVKPLHSSPDNMEVFVICLKFSGLQDDLWNKLHDAVGVVSKSAIVPENKLGASYVDQLLECNEYFAGCQIYALKQTIAISRRLVFHFENITLKSIQEFVTSNGIQPLDDQLYTVAKFVPPPPPQYQKIQPPPPPSDSNLN
jgi:hypothetical protein